MAGSDDDHGRSTRPGAEDRGWTSTGWVLSGRSIGRSDDTVCGLHRAQGDEECGFLGLDSRLKSMVSPSLASKPVASGFLVEPQNQGRWVSKFGPRNRLQRFGDLGLKITAIVFWFGTQNQVGYSLSVTSQNQCEEDCMGHVLRSSDLFRLEAGRASVSPVLPQN
jgi:hypothetical protein